MIAKEKCLEIIDKVYLHEEITKEEFEGIKEAIILGIFGALDYHTMNELSVYSGTDYAGAIIDCLKNSVEFRYGQFN